MVQQSQAKMTYYIWIVVLRRGQLPSPERTIVIMLQSFEKLYHRLAEVNCRRKKNHTDNLHLELHDVADLLMMTDAQLLGQQLSVLTHRFPFLARTYAPTLFFIISKNIWLLSLVSQIQSKSNYPHSNHTE